MRKYTELTKNEKTKICGMQLALYLEGNFIPFEAK